MALSKSKIKQINRLKKVKQPEDIARDLGISLTEVLSALPEKERSALLEKTDIPFRIPFLVLLIIAFTAPLAINNLGFDYADLIKRAILQIGVLLIFSLVFFEIAVKGNPPLRRHPVYLPLLVLLGTGVLSALFSTNTTRALIQLWHWVICGSLSFALFNILVARKERLRVLLNVIYIAGCAIALIGILQFLFEFNWIRQSAPPASTFVNRNFASHFIVLVFPLGLGLFITTEKRSYYWLYALTTSLFLIYPFYTKTKAAWLAIAFQVLIVGIIVSLDHLKNHGWNIKSIDRNKFSAGLSALFIFFIFANFDANTFRNSIEFPENEVATDSLHTDPGSHNLWQKVRSILTGESARGVISQQLGAGAKISAAPRFILMRNALEIVKNHPILGVGPDHFRVYYPISTVTGKSDPGLSKTRASRHAHNDYFQFASEMGLSGVMVVLWIVILIGREMRRLMISTYRYDRREDFFFILILGVSILGCGINALFSTVIYRAMPPFLIAVFLAGLLSLYEFNKGEQRLDTKLNFAIPRQVAVACAFVFFLLFCWWSVIQWKWIRADIKRNVFIHYAEVALDWRKVIDTWPEVVALNPYRRDQYKFLVAAYIHLENIPEATRVGEEYMKLFPHDLMNLYNLTLCYLRLKEYEKALPVIDHLYRILPEDKDVLRQRRKVYRGLGRNPV